MSLPTYLVFSLAATQFAALNSLVIPMPFQVRKNYLRFLMTSKLVAKTIYFLKIAQIFVALLFVDAFRTAYIVTLKPEAEKFNSGLDGGDMSMTASTGSNARKLLAERNMNLTATSLFLSFLLWRVYELSMDVVRYGERVAKAEGQDTGPNIDDHKEVFRHHWNRTKPDHDAATRKRKLQNKGVPVPDHEDSKKAEQPLTSTSS